MAAKPQPEFQPEAETSIRLQTMNLVVVWLEDQLWVFPSRQDGCSCALRCTELSSCGEFSRMSVGVICRGFSLWKLATGALVFCWIFEADCTSSSVHSCGCLWRVQIFSGLVAIVERAVHLDVLSVGRRHGGWPFFRIRHLPFVDAVAGTSFQLFAPEFLNVERRRERAVAMFD